MRLVAFGCSNTFGSSLPENLPYGNGIVGSTYAWPHVLANKLNVPCVNKGFPAASNKLISHMLHNTVLYPTDIVMVLWTYIDRWSVIETDTYEEFSPCNIGVWNKDARGIAYFKHIYNETDSKLDANYRINNANLYLNHLGIKHIQTSCCPSIKNPSLTDIEFEKLQHIDYGNDNNHPGIKAHMAIAETLYTRIVQ